MKLVADSPSAPAIALRTAMIIAIHFFTPLGSILFSFSIDIDIFGFRFTSAKVEQRIDFRESTR